MGGDFAPTNAVLGAMQAYDHSKDFVLKLVGRKQAILDVASSNNLTVDDDMIINADEVIEMGDSPTASLKQKPDSSIVVGAWN